jgi:plastocyanin
MCEFVIEVAFHVDTPDPSERQAQAFCVDICYVNPRLESISEMVLKLKLHHLEGPQRSCLAYSLRALLFFLLLHSNDITSQAADTGSLSGVVRYKADSESPWRYQRYYVADANTGALAETVVALKPIEAFPSPFPAKHTRITVDQENFQFVPETVVVQTGDKVAFTNSDETLHNVMLTHPDDAFNVNLAKDEVYEHQFKAAVETMQPHRLGCVYHGSMRGWVFVFDHPFFALTRKDGTFSMEDIPVGNYHIEVHHPAGKLISTRPITIVRNKAHTQDIELSPEHIKKRTPKKKK